MFGVSKTRYVIRLFENLKMFYPPEGVCFAAPKGSNCFYLCFIGVGRGTGGVNLPAVFCLFENLKMFYPPEGLCAEQSPKVVQLFLLMFYLGKETYIGLFIYRRFFAFLRP